jgi:hypothetical protein
MANLSGVVTELTEVVVRVGIVTYRRFSLRGGVVTLFPEGFQRGGGSHRLTELGDGVEVG